MVKIAAQLLDRAIIKMAAAALKMPENLPPNHAAANELLYSPSFLCAPPMPNWEWKSDTAFEFQSAIETPYANNNCVRGKFVRAANWKNAPTVILVHGWNDELGYMLRFPWMANLLRKRGINSLFIQLPCHMARRPKEKNAPRDFISCDLHSTVRSAQQAVSDLRSCLTWLNSETTGKVSMWGLSLGALLTGILIEHDPRVHSAVLMIPVYDLERAFCELAFCEPIRKSLRTGKLDFSGLNIASRTPLTHRENLLIIEAEHDVFAPRETVEALWEKWDRPLIQREKHGHISILFSIRVVTQTANWLRQRFDS